ncbi:MAG: hypothetical protein U5Q03_01535 [Bacteroidota bacterium]|nr:hypothetical protein [Bacteroidota bacterium]
MVKNDNVISYVAIRGDENREGYVSTKPNIQTVFPFRKNIWSLEITNKVLGNNAIAKTADLYKKHAANSIKERALDIIHEPTSKKFLFSQKLNALLDLNVSLFNQVVFEFFKELNYPISELPDFPLLDNEDVIVREDVVKLFEENGVTFPEYYKELEYEVDGQKGKYARSRSGCYFCFYQQKIEWVWLYETHRKLFNLAMKYEKNGYTWNESESLEEIIQPERI